MESRSRLAAKTLVDLGNFEVGWTNQGRRSFTTQVKRHLRRSIVRQRDLDEKEQMKCHGHVPTRSIPTLYV